MAAKKYKDALSEDKGFQALLRTGAGLTVLRPYCDQWAMRNGYCLLGRTTIKDIAAFTREMIGVSAAPVGGYQKNKGEKIANKIPYYLDAIPAKFIPAVERRETPRDEVPVFIKDRIRAAILKSKNAMSVEEVADNFDCAPKTVRSAVDELRAEHYMASISEGYVSLNKRPETSKKSTIPRELHSGGNIIRFGSVSDTHLCSRYERIPELEAMYDIFQEEGINLVFHSGNHIDGEARFNKQDIHTHGMDNQIRYFVDKYPQREGIHTHFITGDDHEGWYVSQTGIDIGERTEDLARKAGRTDLHHLGYMEHDFLIPAEKGETAIRVVHPGGGTAYAISYQPQKIIESLSGGEKPQIMLVGHYHKADYIYYRNIHCIQAGTFCDQTPFMRKKRLAAHVGGWICEAHQAPDGSITRFKSEWVPFFDREYYKKWSYKMRG